ncbi:hypothetical protein SAMN05216238_10325 [Lentibacillus persicus]|uniref:DUF1850 domain-containing protein n=1 Tax=Lentibacillus persicus TaxID=640948 RepID=A0A1I1UAS5_9BACI|nr:DUF1850 domain-containing protein [Lentibacillus persicus]SFD65863.1 hypothetical protein SAMN05216238_10325 [Lentibacillus persicus]
MTASSGKRQSLYKRRLAVLLISFIIFAGIYLFTNDVYVMYAMADNGDVLIAERINADTTFSSRYLHSVAKCPIIEKYEVNKAYEMVLMESWNCSFGAGIETNPPPGATDRMEDGYYVIDDIEKTFQEILFHPVSIAEQKLTIDGRTWNISQKPFEGRTFSLVIEQENWFSFLSRM